jgi:hypothetical protein
MTACGGMCAQPSDALLIAALGVRVSGLFAGSRVLSNSALDRDAGHLEHENFRGPAQKWCVADQFGTEILIATRDGTGRSVRV